MSIGERLREERDRLGHSQPKFAAIAETTKQTLFSWETGKTAPDGNQLAAFAAAGVDVLYVLTGDRIGARSSKKPSESSDAIDAALFIRIADKLDALALSLKKRWPERTKVEQVVKIYNYLAHDADLAADDDKIERTLRLVVNQ